MILTYLRILLKDPTRIFKVSPKRILKIISLFFSVKSKLIIGYFFNIIINLLLILFKNKKHTKKGNILFVGEIYFSENKKCKSSNYYGPYLSLKKENIEFDSYFISNNLFKKISIFHKIIFSGYKKIILSSNTPDDPEYFTYFQIKILKEKYGIEFINILWDTCDKKFFPKRKDVYICDKNIVGDQDFKKAYNYKKDNIYQRIFTFDEEELITLSNNRDLKKDIDLIFIGQTGAYRGYRLEILNFLKANTNIFTSEKLRNDFLPDDEYFNLMSRAKMTVNFSMSVDFHQIKGRCLESFIFKTLVFEDERSPLTEYFRPDLELITYKNKHDLLDKINFYSKNDIERERITNNAKKKYITDYNEKNYWKGII